jgi:hypothetical protein
MTALVAGSRPEPMEGLGNAAGHGLYAGAGYDVEEEQSQQSQW